MTEIIGKSVPDFGIELDRIYIYTCELPKGCKGMHYKAHRLVLDVPSYQWKILMEALDGIDRGLWFTCTPANFILRYALLQQDEQHGIRNESPGQQSLSSETFAASRS